MLFRLTARVVGQVQNVLLRASVRQYCQAHALGGFVRNEEDLSVTVVAEGDKTTLTALVSWLTSSPGHATVTAVREHWQKITQAIPTFTIRY